VRVPANTKIGHDLEQDKARGFTVTENGIVVVPKGYKFA
jgi:glucose-1-phosphate adenylyltransferase